MSFAHPGVLWALGALALPILLHLFRFRPRKTLIFSDLRFVEETRSQSSARQKLLQRLLLAARLLLFAALIFAFAQPRFGDVQISEAKGNRIWLAFDNSPSMNSGSSGSSLLEKARDAVRAELQALEADATVVLWTPDQGRSSELSKDEAIDRIDRIEAGSERCTELEMYAQVQTAEAGFRVWLVSDFQSEPSALVAEKPDSTLADRAPQRAVEAMLLQNRAWAELPYLDSIWFAKPYTRPGLRQELVCSLRNPSKEAQKAQLQVSLSGQALGMVDIQLKPLQDSSLRFGFNVPDSAASHGKASLRFEENQNAAFGPGFEQNFAVNPGRPITVALIGEPGLWSSLLPPPDFEIKTLSSLAGLGGLDCDFAILDRLDNAGEGDLEALSDFEETGGSILLYPPEDPLVFEKLNTWLKSRHSLQWGVPLDTQKSRWGTLNLKHPLWSGSIEEVPDRADMPVNRRAYPIQGRRYEAAATDARGSAMVMRSGRLCLIGTRPEAEWSNIGSHPLWVPLVLNTAFAGAEAIPPSISTLENRLEVSGVEIGRQIAWLHKGQREVPEQKRGRIVLSLSLETARADGYPYVLVDEDAKKLGAFYLNAEPVERSRNYRSAEELPSNWRVRSLDVQGSTPAVEGLDLAERDEFDLWKKLLIAALIFALIEAAIFRFDPFKSPKTSPTSFETTRNAR